MADPALDDLIARVAALEEAGPYPGLAVLQRKLEQNWNPDADSVLAPGSITIGLLDGAMKFGTGTVTWPGGSDTSGTTAMLHGLGRTPTIVLVQSQTIIAAGRPANLTTTGFNVALKTLDGSLPAIASTTSFWWLAL